MRLSYRGWSSVASSEHHSARRPDRSCVAEKTSERMVGFADPARFTRQHARAAGQSAAVRASNPPGVPNQISSRSNVMDGKRPGLAIAMIVTLSLQSGCSFLFVKGPPANHAKLASVDCSDSNAWPVLDTIWAGLNGLGAVTAAGDATTPNQGQVIGVGLAWLAVSGISAIYGFSQVSACSDARRQHDEQLEPRGLAGRAPDPDAPGPPLTAPASAPMRAAPAAARAPAPAAAPAPAPAAAPAPAPAAAPAPAPAAAPATTPAPSRSSSRALPPRSLAMRPALAAS